jgi:hypothetical protein
MTIDLATAVAALEGLTHEALRNAGDVTLRQFHQLAYQWSATAAEESRKRAAPSARRSQPLSRPLAITATSGWRFKEGAA